MSRNLGFLKAGGDVDGVLAQLQKDLDYRGIAMAMPIIDRLVRLNPITKLLGRTTRSGYFAMRSRAILEDRLAEADQSDRKGEVRRPAGQPSDLADRLLEAQRKDPRISEGQLVGYLQTNLVAGSDTTAIVLRTAIYYSLRHPWIQARIVDEVDRTYSGSGRPLPGHPRPPRRRAPTNSISNRAMNIPLSNPLGWLGEGSSVLHTFILKYILK